MSRNEQVSFGVFKPVGCVVISFPQPEQADQATAALAMQGFGEAAVRRYNDREMIQQIDEDIVNASPLAAVGQEMNLVLSHRALAAKGYHWLVVRAGSDEQARQVAATAERFGAERAQHYGHFIIEELIERPGQENQVAESPDRGLDAQTPSGKEAERAELKKA